MKKPAKFLPLLPSGTSCIVHWSHPFSRSRPRYRSMPRSLPQCFGSSATQKGRCFSENGKNIISNSHPKIDGLLNDIDRLLWKC